MRTAKPISTVSFNTKEYLKSTLDNLVESKVLSWYCFIPHKAEDDDAGKKDHFHVYAEPSKTLQTDDLRSEFKEYDPEMPDKPRSTLVWKSSKFYDWYQYSLHDPAYLASKGLRKKYWYRQDEFITSEEDELLDRVANFPVTPTQRMLEEIQRGTPFEHFVAMGCVPVRQIMQYRLMWNTLWQFMKEANYETVRDKNIEYAKMIIDGFVEVPDEAPPFGDI